MPSSTPWGFRRTTVVGQTATALREAIRRGELRDPFPGSHQLARQLGISRPTVGAAFRELAAEGLLVVQQGRRARINSRCRPRASAGQPAVCVICPVTLSESVALAHPILLEMHAEFASRGVGWDVVFESRFRGRRPEARLSEVVAGRPRICWILLAVAEPIQRWFAASGIPAVVLGSCVPGLQLPSVDLNYGAVGWHAAGAIVRQGHKRLGLILPARMLPGDAATRDQFLRYLKERAAGVCVSDCRMPDDPVRREVTLDRLLAGPQRPTAVLSQRPALTLAVVLHALRRGLSIPRDLSIVSRDTLPVFDAAVPELTRYSSTATKLTSRIVKIALHLLAGRKVPSTPNLLTPQFIAGATLAATPL